jgi:hypothetical protein
MYGIEFQPRQQNSGSCNRKRAMTPEQQTTLDATLASVGSKATYTGATTSILGWVLSSEFGILLGVILGIGGFLVNWYYKAKQDSREQAEHDRRMGLYE